MSDKMKLIMENWRGFSKKALNEDPFADAKSRFRNLDSALDSAEDELFRDDPFSKKESPKIKEFKQRLSKLGFSEKEVDDFITFEGMGMGGTKEQILEKKIIALEEFSNTPFNKMPQTMKVTPGRVIQMRHNRLSWKGKVGDPEAPTWVQTLIPGWKTSNPVYPSAPTSLGMSGRVLLVRKLKAAFAKTQ
tara:strand:- start:370 stop:939 length:570 start_codon:yes stop_codon:yes gene_type:complete